MPGESPTKWQAQAYRFGVRRLESAVSDGDPLLRGDRVRRRLNIAVIVSVIVAALLLGGFAVYGLISPAPEIGNAAVVIDEDTGGVFVARDGRLYPAMNLSSALLAAGRGQSGTNKPSTTTVDTDTISDEPRGPQLGIPGAPDVLPSGSHLAKSAWTACDTTTVDSALPPDSPPKLTTTAIIGHHRPRFGSLGTTGGLLVSADKGVTTYLVWNGQRSKIDLGDDTIRLAFKLGADVKARPMSAALLNLIPESPDITVPQVVGAGGQPSWARALGVRVGDVFALQRADRTRAIYVAWNDGVQPITPLIGDLIRDEFDVTKAIPLVPPAVLRASPRTAHPIDTTLYPTRSPEIVAIDDYAVTCVFRHGTDDAAEVSALVRLPIGPKAKPVGVARPGPLVVNDVYIKPGDGAVVTVATKPQTSGARALYVITDDGVAYPVVSVSALTYLGLAEKVTPTAPALLTLLPKGPTLDPDAASRFYPQTGSSASGLPAPSAGSGS